MRALAAETGRSHHHYLLAKLKELRRREGLTGGPRTTTDLGELVAAIDRLTAAVERLVPAGQFGALTTAPQGRPGLCNSAPADLGIYHGPDR